MDLKQTIKNYVDQTSINESRVKKILTATMQYNMDIPTLIRFLGGNYTGECRDSKATIHTMKNVKCNERFIEYV